jgi:hypothetical protein
MSAAELRAYLLVGLALIGLACCIEAACSGKTGNGYGCPNGHGYGPYGCY